jgi:hypothetical protein
MVWYSYITKIKNRKVCELAKQINPGLLANIDEKFTVSMIQNRPRIAHLLYNDESDYEDDSEEDD